MLKLGDYGVTISPRKRDYLPLYPFAITPNTDLRTTTTTAILRTVSDVKFAGITGSSMAEMGARLETNGQYVQIPWRAPDDLYTQEDISVRFTFALNNTTTTAGAAISPVVTAMTRQIGDINLTSPVPETFKATPTEIDVLDEDITLTDAHYVRTPYRSLEGTIAKGTITPGDMVMFKIALDGAPSGGLLLLVFGIEVDYWLALRDTQPEKL